ncbi:hypothetical protein C8R44DRAFT_768962 [Mycena epipterygia]|nr:hypothetical protein C8R44DRAFT_768962 [Mycena epipterygia]
MQLASRASTKSTRPGPLPTPKRSPFPGARAFRSCQRLQAQAGSAHRRNFSVRCESRSADTHVSSRMNCGASPQSLSYSDPQALRPPPPCRVCARLVLLTGAPHRCPLKDFISD